ncbi:hypothetical protein ONZ45_g8242 [Pleurotus djamor]|nr:hypothetical protein ONZ45_g8242 [Pleurotus djamor]
MIQRTKSAPLFISGSSIGDPGLDEISSVVMSNIHRIQGLDVAGIESDKLFEFLRMNPGESAPILRVLILRGPIISLPKDILERGMDSLQELQMVHGALSFPIPPLPQLKKLLVYPPGHVASRLSLDVLLESLRNTPSIEEIYVRRVYVPDDPSMKAKLSAVHLPRMTRFNIDGLAIQSSKLLSLLEHPQTANITYRCQESIRPGSDLSDLQNALIRFASLPGRVTCGVSIMTDQATFDIALHTRLHSSSHIFVLTLQDMFKDDFGQLLSAVNFSKATSLDLSGVGDIIQPSHLLSLCDNVEVLTLTDCPVAVFDGLMKAGDQKIPSPKLRTLVVNECRIYDPYKIQDASMCHDTMLSLLKQRTQLAMGIKQLTIRDCDITKDIIDKYKVYVQVDWDGREVDDEDDDGDVSFSEEDDLF